jgi:hypothetical protein
MARIVGLLGLIGFLFPLAATAQTWRYFTFEYNQSGIAPPSNGTGAYLCAIEGWTIENSGFPVLATGWNSKILPSGPNNPDALAVVLDSIDATATGLCDFVAVPWYAPQIHDVLLERLEFRSLQVVPSLEGGAVAEATAKYNETSSIEVDQKVDEVFGECNRNPYSKMYYDCACIADQTRKRLDNGEFSLLSGLWDMNRLLYPDPSAVCVDREKIARASLENCESFQIFGGPQAQKIDCSCVVEKASRAFLENPGIDTRNTKTLLSVGIVPERGQFVCRTP